MYHYGIWHRVSRCTYPRCALLRDTIVGHCPCTGMDESVGARRHTKTTHRWLLSTHHVDDSGITSRKLLSMRRHGRGWWCAPAHRITRRWLLSTQRRGRQWWNAPHNTLRVTIHAPAWTKVVVCVCTPSVTICNVYRRQTRVSRQTLCCAPARNCLLYTSPSPRDGLLSRMPSSA